MIYVSYSDNVETIDENEPELFARIAETFLSQSRTTTEQLGRAVRASHAKSTAALDGELIVEEGLAPELAQGLFARPARYRVLVRMAQGPGELLDDRISTHRGVAIKVIGVEGERIAESPERATQDFVLEGGKAFINANATRFLANLKAGVSNAPALPEGVKNVVSKIARGTEAALEAVGGKSKTLDFFGHPPLHPLSEAYFSQVPMRWGDHIAKVGLFPGEGLLATLRDIEVDTGDDADAFRHAVAAHFRSNPAEFELRAQLCTDLEAMPVEDASVEWPEEDSPYRRVARLVLPPQPSGAAERLAYVDDRLSFQPANSLAAHRPLGQIMHARLAVYGQLVEYRRGVNGVAAEEPAAG